MPWCMRCTQTRSAFVVNYRTGLPTSPSCSIAYVSLEDLRNWHLSRTPSILSGKQESPATPLPLQNSHLRPREQASRCVLRACHHRGKMLSAPGSAVRIDRAEEVRLWERAAIVKHPSFWGSSRWRWGIHQWSACCEGGRPQTESIRGRYGIRVSTSIQPYCAGPEEGDEASTYGRQKCCCRGVEDRMSSARLTPPKEV